MVRKTDILDEGTQRTKGIDAFASNIEAAKAVSEIVKTTLGPMGMDKMLIDSIGNTVITNDGVKILKEMEIEHPGAKIMVEVAKTQDLEVGDGTTTAVILAGELLNNAQKLIKQKIHPTTIIRIYKEASEKAIEILKENSTKINISDKTKFKHICETAMYGKIAEFSKDTLTEIIFETVERVKENNEISKKKIKIQKVIGGETKESFLVSGVVLDKNPANPNMPKKLNNCKVLIVDFPLEVRELESEAKININSLEQYEEFLKNEQEYLKSIVYQIKKIKANVVICQKGIDDSIAYYLAKEGILAIRRCKKSDLEKLSYALGKKIISNYDDLTEENLGFAKEVEIKEINNENYIFIKDCENPKAITIFLKASSKYFIDEIERAIEDAIGDINSILKSQKIVAGGGAIELEISKNLINYSKKFTGKEQLIITAFAESFLIIPKVLCENSGFDEIELIPKLISKHEYGEKNSGIDGFKGYEVNTLEKGIIEPLNVKLQAIKSATETSLMLLKIDDIIAAKKLNNKDLENMDY